MNQINPKLDAKPVLLLCSERAGSNLLRCMLDSHSRIYAPNTMALGLLCAQYDSKARRSNPETWKSMLSEVHRRINKSTFYTGVSVDEHELMQNVSENNIGGLYLFAYYKGMAQCGADRIIIKEHQSWRIASFFVEKFPHSKIVVQVRDPRDHAVSCKKLGKLYAAYHGSLPRAAQMWTRDQLGLLQLRERFGAGIVRPHLYEDLVRHPRETLQGICDFLELEWQESMLDFHVVQAKQRRESEKYLHNMWANLDSPVTASSIGQWKKHLKQYELQTVEREVGQLLIEFGYDVKSPDESFLDSIMCTIYQFCAAIRYSIVTVGIWFVWLWVTHDYSVPLKVVLGNTVRAHLPYERFRDRFGYRL